MCLLSVGPYTGRGSYLHGVNRPEAGQPGKSAVEAWRGRWWGALGAVGVLEGYAQGRLPKANF